MTIEDEERILIEIETGRGITFGEVKWLIAKVREWRARALGGAAPAAVAVQTRVSYLDEEVDAFGD